MAPDDLSKLRIDKTAAIKAPAGKKKRYIYIGVSVIALLLIVFLVVSGRLSPAVTVQATTVGQVYPSQTFTLLNASGYIVAQRKAALSAKTTGRIVALLVEEGSKVKKGDIIARLESDDVRAGRDQAAANLERAKAELHDATLAYDRNRELVKSGYIARSEFDASEARFKGARAALEANAAALRAADVSIGYTLIKAPFDGVVLTKNADIGDVVTPFGATANVQAAVVTMADMESLLAQVDVSEANIGKVELEQPCEIQLDSLPDIRFRGAVHMIVPTADRSKATILVKVRFIDRDSRILPEMSAKVAFLSREPSAGELKPIPAVSKNSVVTRDGKTRIFRIDGDRVAETEIRTGRELGDYLELLGGVKIGERIVARPPDGIKDGSRIKIEEK